MGNEKSKTVYVITVLWKGSQQLRQNPSPQHGGSRGNRWAPPKGEAWHLVLLCLSSRPPFFSPRAYLEPQQLWGIHWQVKTPTHKPQRGKFIPQLSNLSALAGPMDPLSEGSTQSKVSETRGQNPIQREQRGGNIPVSISKWEPMGGRAVWPPCCLTRALGVFKSQTHPNHICCFQNDSGILAAQKPLWCLEAVDLKWKCESDKRKAAALAETAPCPSARTRRHTGQSVCSRVALDN